MSESGPGRRGNETGPTCRRWPTETPTRRKSWFRDVAFPRGCANTAEAALTINTLRTFHVYRLPNAAFVFLNTVSSK
jgi:hypothetical protein